MPEKISILGCGWLGLPLAETLLRQNYSVAGSTTSPGKLPLLTQKGITAFLLDLNDPEAAKNNAEFFEAETLIVNVPPNRKSGNSYALQIRNLKNLLHEAKVQKLLFISSTGVYLPSDETIKENSPIQDAETDELVQAEKLISATVSPWQTTIIRFAGLFGPGREPGRFLSGKTDLPDADSTVNLIHQTDCIRIIQAILAQQKWGEIYNACSDGHPSRKVFYVAAARRLNLPEPSFAFSNIQGNSGKLISNQKLKTELDFEFQYPDPLQWLASDPENGRDLA